MIEVTEHTGEIDDLAIAAMWSLVQRCFDPSPTQIFADVVREKRNPAAVIAWNERVYVGKPTWTTDAFC